MHTDLLRFAAAGSVDDGKSTLIGRLLYDAKAILADQLQHVAAVSARRGGGGEVDLSLLTDGLRAEREQGITIDVAYRFFATPRRRFIVADTPGHAQYTRNMVTGASTADLALIIVDASKGLTEQSRRHAAIAALLRVPKVTVVVNKLDLVGFSEEAFDTVVREFWEWIPPPAPDRPAALGLHDVTFIPVSALHGDNVVEPSPERLEWYDGPALLEHLETVEVDAAPADAPARLPVQYVIRADGERRYAGRVASGVLRDGDEVVVLPSGLRTTVAAIDGPDGPLCEAGAPLSVAVRLADELDVGRGDLLAAAEDAPAPARELSATLCWMGDAPARPGARYELKHATRTVQVRLDAIEHRIDVVTLDRVPAPDGLSLNELGAVRLRLAGEIAADPYASSRATGAFILIDPATNDTVAAGMIA